MLHLDETLPGEAPPRRVSPSAPPALFPLLLCCTDWEAFALPEKEDGFVDGATLAEEAAAAAFISVE